MKRESATEMWTRLNQRAPLKVPGAKLFDSDSESLQPCHIYELCGPSGSGKSLLLLDLACHFLAPVDEGGLGLRVLFIDNDETFDVLRLSTMIEAKFNKVGDVQEKMKTCLKRLQFFLCDDSHEFIETLQHIEKTLSCNLRPVLSGNHCDSVDSCLPAVLIVDSISAFYQFDRYDEETRQENRPQLVRLHREYAQRLSHLAVRFNMVVLVSHFMVEVTATPFSDMCPDLPAVCPSVSRFVLPPNTGQPPTREMGAKKQKFTTSENNEIREHVKPIHYTTTCSSKKLVFVMQKPWKDAVHCSVKLSTGVKNKTGVFEAVLINSQTGHLIPNHHVCKFAIHDAGVVYN